VTEIREIFRQCDEALPGSSCEYVCPEVEIFVFYMIKRVDRFIFSHLRAVYLTCKKELSYMGKIPILNEQKWDKNWSDNKKD